MLGENNPGSRTCRTTCGFSQFLMKFKLGTPEIQVNHKQNEKAMCTSSLRHFSRKKVWASIERTPPPNFLQQKILKINQHGHLYNTKEVYTSRDYPPDEDRKDEFLATNVQHRYIPVTGTVKSVMNKSATQLASRALTAYCQFRISQKNVTWTMKSLKNYTRHSNFILYLQTYPEFELLP